MNDKTMATEGSVDAALEKVAKGSFLHKLILVPSALAISALAPWAIIPLLMIGGAFLCYEGFEKVAHRFLHSKADDDARHQALAQAMADPAVDLVVLEKDRIKGAVRTDFILSAEIIVITLGIVADASFATQVAVLVGIAFIMTVGVYGLVAGIVKLDDAGLYLSRRDGDTPHARMQRSIGAGILRAAPWLMKGLSVAGTAAMFLVGGSILIHGVPPVHHWIEHIASGMESLPAIGGALGFVVPILADAVVGMVAGAMVLGAVSGVQRVLRPRPVAH